MEKKNAKLDLCNIRLQKTLKDTKKYLVDSDIRSLNCSENRFDLQNATSLLEFVSRFLPFLEEINLSWNDIEFLSHHTCGEIRGDPMFDKKQFLDIVTQLTNKKVRIHLEGNNIVEWHFLEELEWNGAKHLISLSSACRS